eukprot:TRINITY_DN3451_c0_g1_i2.p1 TRINITY_DN3451_c0_g1~~TRINITY_DN3451_c0_g1_i2.p1  ORF type:complete len:581 (+),score=137.83 TRINITY_DN3451_c0_g1_i2:144-1886(+)
MAASFFDYEKANNILLDRLLRDDRFTDVLVFIEQNEASVFLPQSVTLENIEITRDFVETHVVICNPSESRQWMTMNGFFGMFNTARETVHIVGDKESRFDPLVPLPILFESVSDMFVNFDVEGDKKPVVVLREGHFSMDDNASATSRLDAKIVPLILISEPLPVPQSSSLYHKAAEILPPAGVALPSHKRAPSKEIATNDLISFSDEPRTSGEYSSASPTAASAPVNPAKAWGLRDFLTQFGSVTSSYLPLFPETASDANEGQSHPQNDDKRGSNTSSPVSSQPNRTQVFFTKLKSPQAADVVKTLKNFVNGFIQQRPESIEQQGQMVRSFVDFMEDQIMKHPLWKDANEDELDGVLEGLEKFVMTKLFDSIFTKHCEDPENVSLEKRIAKLEFVDFSHLEIKQQYQIEKSISLACSELRKINNYKTPRDKLVCVWNCCKVIYSILNKATDGTPGADEFLPLAIYVVLKSNPKFLHSNIQYIYHFRHPSKLATESGYYFTQVESAVSFIRTLDNTKLSAIDADEFNKHMEKSPQLPKAYKFSSATAADVTAKDVPLLLQEYKSLITENERLREELRKFKR